MKTVEEIFNIVNKAPKQIGYTEIWECISDEAIKALEDEGYDVYFQHLDWPAIHPLDKKGISRDITYVTWNESAYFNRIEREGLEEA